MMRRLPSSLRRNVRGAVAIEAAAVMALVTGTVLVAVPEFIHQTRAMSQIARATAITADLLGAQATVLTDADFARAVQMANWAIEPLDSSKLAFRAQGFVRPSQGADVTQAWSVTSGSGCSPGTAGTADAERLVDAENHTMIVVSSCYELPPLTGFMEERVVQTRFWQTARRGVITRP
jgi:hypothetical protein